MLKLLLSPLFRLGLTISLGILFVFLCFHYQWFSLLDLKIYDLGLAVRPQSESQSDIVIIVIDRYSRESCFQPPYFPISNHILEHSQVVERLVQAGAKAIAFDILFDQLDPQLDLEPFVSALSKAKNVILASVIEKQSLKVRDQGTSIEEERMILPSGRIPSSLYNLGLANVPVDPDQLVRQAYPGKEFQGRWYPSLPAALVKAFLNKQAPDFKVSEPFYIDYSPPKSGFVSIPYVDILKKEGWEGLVKGKIALIGVTENGLSDSHFSPVFSLEGISEGKRLPGVFVLAHAGETLLRDNMIAMLPLPLSSLFCFLLIIGSSVLALGKRLILNLVLMTILTIVLLVCGIVLNVLNLTILPTGKLIAASILTVTIGIFVNYSYTKLKSVEQESKLEEISSDLKVAKEIQQKLQPENIPIMKEVEVSGLQIPCREIGGDYYDVIQLNERTMAVLIADVSGKGISGALVMSNLQSAFRGLTKKILSPSQLVGELNTVVSQIAGKGRFVTLFYGILDLATKKFVYSNAGHPYPILCHPTGKMTHLSEGGLFLGPFPKLTWQEWEVQLEKGDCLFMYTDGVTEATFRKTEEQFEEKRLLECLRQNIKKSAKELNQEVVCAVQRFTRRQDFDDDVTLLSLKIQ